MIPKHTIMYYNIVDFFEMRAYGPLPLQLQNPPPVSQKGGCKSLKHSSVADTRSGDDLQGPHFLGIALFLSSKIMPGFLYPLYDGPYKPFPHALNLHMLVTHSITLNLTMNLNPET